MVLSDRHIAEALENGSVVIEPLADVPEPDLHPEQREYAAGHVFLRRPHVRSLRAEVFTSTPLILRFGSS